MFTKQLITVEHHCLKIRYAHLRLHKRRAAEQLTASMEQHGQLVPVVLVPEMRNQWVLIDGHLRIKALRRLGRDTVEAEIWPCDITEALLMVFKNHSARSLMAFEETLLLHELHTQHGLSQTVLASRIGRDQSWVSRRLSLLEFLPNGVLQALSRGSISLWIATRVLTPMARAMPKHTECLLNYLLKYSHSTREIQSFYEHYQKSNRRERNNMIDNPALFFKTHRYLEAEKEAALLKEGLEGKWQSQCRAVGSLLSELILLAPRIIYPRQAPEERSRLFQVFNYAKSQFNTLTEILGRLLDAH